MADGILKNVNRIEGKVEASGVQGSMPICIYRNWTASAASAAASTQTLGTYSMPASTLDEDGKTVVVKAWYTTAANTNTKTFLLTFNGTTVATSAASAFAASTVAYVEATVIRTGAATQLSHGRYSTNDTTSVTTAGLHSANGAPTATLTSAVDILAKVTQGSASADATLVGMEVWLY